MINWKNLCGSRCAIDTMYDWLELDISTTDLMRTLKQLGFKTEAAKIYEYFHKYEFNKLIKNMKAGLKRNNC